MAHSGKEAVRLCEHIIRQAFGDVVCVSPPSTPKSSVRANELASRFDVIEQGSTWCTCHRPSSGGLKTEYDRLALIAHAA